jgi:hypothetical protein
LFGILEHLVELFDMKFSILIPLSLLVVLFFFVNVDGRVVGFYHVWTPDPIPHHAINILQEQIQQIIDSHAFSHTSKLHISLIGNASSLPILIQNFFYENKDTKQMPLLTFSQTESGYEPVTVKQLWNHCHSHPNDMVWYLHNKGTFHPSVNNDLLRSLLTNVVLSSQCLDELESGSDACGMRFTNDPHRHFNGNMWIAKCSYIKLLPDPTIERGIPCEGGGQIKVGGRWTKCFYPTCIATDRYYIEHWIGYLIDGVMSDCLKSNISFKLLSLIISKISFHISKLNCVRFQQPYPSSEHSGCATMNYILDQKLYGTKAKLGAPKKIHWDKEDEIFLI